MWYQHGIRYIGDLLDERGSILSMEDLKNIYDIKNINILDYYQIRLLIRSFVGKQKQV